MDINKEFFKSINIHLLISEKLKGSGIIPQKESKMGFCWWFWLPRFKIKRWNVWDFHFLCFNLGATREDEYYKKIFEEKLNNRLRK